MKHIFKERAESLGEQIANSVSHGVGCLLAVAATPILIVYAQNATAVVAASIFGATMILLYLMSTLYHSLPEGRAKTVFQILDHSAIYLLIAGTYTPFTLVVLGGAWGWSLFGVIWGLAVLGVLLEAIGRRRYPAASIILYVAMGWLILIAIRPLLGQLPGWGMFWLATGGFAYTLGIGFYAATGLRYAHLVWHLFVITGTACHFIAVLGYAI